jgi:hypothetical protein
MVERESSINPEAIYGKEFRVPAVVGQGGGSGFKLEGLNLPVGWEKGIPRLKESGPEGLRLFFDLDCKNAHLNSGTLKFDKDTNVLTGITIPIDPVRPARLYLETWRYPGNEEGAYTSENIDDLRTAIILQATACRFLNYINPEMPYAYVEKGGSGYYSENLKVPEKILKMKGQITSDFEQRRFEVKASNIAGRFGFDPVSLKFNEKGLLTSATLSEGGACYYHFNPDFKNYSDHNVDSIWQAAVLHGVCAAFINSQLQRQDI